MNISFEGKTVLITGAAHGFGRAMCLAFATRGAQVWGCDVLPNELQETAHLCNEAGGQCEVRLVDVTDPVGCHAFVHEAAGSNQVDVLVNNAGGVLGQVGRPLEQVTPHDWNAIFAVNTSGAFYMAQAVAPGMKTARYGRIINISSGAGLTISLTGIQAYASAKAATIALTRQLGHELGPHNITVNCIAPGFVRSNPNTERQWESYGADGQKALIDGIAMRRLGHPEDIAHAVLFFASEYAGWITGQVLAVDGGR